MNGVNYGFVQSNTVTINDDNTFSGIRLNGGKHNTLSCNDVIGTNKTTSFSHGIATWASQENTYKCNNVDKTRNGFYFNEDCKGTTFEGNCFGQHYNGVMVDGLATLPPLVNTGNKWSKMSSDYTNFGFNSLILMGQCKFNPNTTIDDCFALRPSQALPPSMSGVNFIPNTLIPEPSRA